MQVISPLAHLHQRLELLRASLSAAVSRPGGSVTPDEREHLKQQIIALYRTASDTATEALALKTSVKVLVDDWKQLDRPPAEAPSAPSVAALPVRVDHLGASTFVEKGWSRLALDDAVGAEGALRRAMELVPQHNEAEALLSWSLMLQGRLDEAAAAAQTVVARDPSYALAEVNLGYIALQRGESARAIEHLAHALQLGGDHKAILYAHLYLGMVYRGNGMHAEAESFFVRTLALGPNCLQAWYELGWNRWEQGQPTGALDAWRAGSEANKFSPWGKRCAELIRRVEQGEAPQVGG